MTIADTRYARLDLIVPRGYPKTFQLRFWATVVYDGNGDLDEGASTPEDLSTWTGWTGTALHPPAPPVDLAADAFAAATGIILVTVPATLTRPTSAWVLAGTDPTSTPVPVLGGALSTDPGAATTGPPPINSIITIDLHVTPTTVDVVRIAGGSSGGGTGVTVHNALSGRSSADAHPTAAITGLDLALAAVDAALTALSTAVATKADLSALTAEATARAAADTAHAGIVDGTVHGINALIAAAIAALVDSSPGTLDTLNELAAALADDPNFATTITTLVATKADLSALTAEATARAAADTAHAGIVDGTVHGINALIAAAIAAQNTPYAWDGTSSPAGSPLILDTAKRNVVQTDALTAPAYLELPLANSLPVGTAIRVADKSNTVSGTKLIVISPQPGNTITNPFYAGSCWIAVPGGSKIFINETTTSWTQVGTSPIHIDPSTSLAPTDLSVPTSNAVLVALANAIGALPQIAGSGHINISPPSGGIITVSDTHLVDIRDYGAISGDATDDLAAFTAAIAACPSGGTVLVPAGTWHVSAPIVVPSNITLRGEHAPRWSYGGGGSPCVIKALAGFAGAAIISLATGTNGARIRNVGLDGGLVAAGTLEGIHADGSVRDLEIEDVDLTSLPGHGIRCINAGANNPKGLRLARVSAYNCGRGGAGSGFSLVNVTDSHFEDLLAVQCASSGIYAENCYESTFVACRAVFCTTNGMQFAGTGTTTSSTSLGQTTVIAPATDRNGQCGILVTQEGEGPIQIIGARCRRDGSNIGGGTTSCGIKVLGSGAGANLAVPVDIIAAQITPGVDDGGSGSESPLYGIRATNAERVSIHGGEIWAVTAAYSTAGTATAWASPDSTWWNGGRATKTAEAPAIRQEKIVGLVPANDDFMQRKSGLWVNRSLAQAMTDLVGTTEFEDGVRAQSIDQMTPPAAAVSWNGQLLASLASGNAESDAARLDVTDAWILTSNTWTRTSNTTFTVPTDLTARFRPGTKVKWKESGVQKHGAVKSSSYSSPNTTVTLIATDDYVMAASPDANTAHWSHGDPDDAPTSFAWTPAWTSSGWSANPIATCFWSVKNRLGLMKVVIATAFANTSNSTSTAITLPAAPVKTTNSGNFGIDNAVACPISTSVAISTGVCTFLRAASTTTWTASGAKAVNLDTEFPIR